MIPLAALVFVALVVDADAVEEPELDPEVFEDAELVALELADLTLPVVDTLDSATMLPEELDDPEAALPVSLATAPVALPVMAPAP